MIELSPIERDIIELTAAGLNIRRIAKYLKKPYGTIETYRYRLHEKTGSKNAPNLVAWAFRNGVIH